MEYEQKYNAALERAAKLRIQNPFDTIGQMVEHIFPELKESMDERIKREILELISIAGNGNQFEEIKDWLEKQGEHKPYGQRKECEDCQFNYAGECKGYCALKRNEHKPTDKVEPKFHNGDWVVNEVTGLAYQIKNCSESLNNHEYGYDLTNGGYIGSDEVNLYHLWTIENAKHGDVLVDADGEIGMFDECYDFEWMSFCSLGNRGFRYFTVKHENEKTHPANKEQCELLFSKMKEAGWELDTEEKVLKKIKYKFNVNDWIVTDDSFGKIVRHIDELNLIDNEYVASDENGLIYGVPFRNEHKWHKWTIQDAEDGDLLTASDNSIFIYAGTDGPYAKFYIALTTLGTFNFEGGRWENKDAVRPVTEEERKTFFEKLKDKKLEWNLKNKCIHYMASC